MMRILILATLLLMPISVSAQFFPVTIMQPTFQQGMSGYWPCSETSGTTCADLSGNGRTAALLNAPIRGAGPFNRALTYNGTNQYANAGTGPLSTSHFSFSAWVKPTALGNPQQIISHGTNSGSDTQAQMYESSGSGNVIFATYKVYNNASYGTTSNHVLTINNWNLVTGIFDGSNWSIYWNGSLDSSQVNPAPSAVTSALCIGAVDTDSVGHVVQLFNGAIADPRVYERALTSTEIAQLYSYRP